MRAAVPDPHRPRRRRLRALALAGLVVAAVVGAVHGLQGRDVTAPDWLRDRVAEHLSASLPDVRIAFDSAGAVLDADWRPRLSLRNLEVRSLVGEEILSVADLRVRLDGAGLLRGGVVIEALDASGVVLTLQRARDGTITLAAGTQVGRAQRRAANLPALVSDLNRLLQRPGLAALAHADVRAITLRYDDLRAGRSWTVDGGRMRLERDGGDLQIALDLAVLGGASGVATLSANYAGTVGRQAADFGVTLANLDARDIASQGPEFAWLRTLEAPISGALRGGLTEEGRFEPLNATFQIGAGVIQPTPQARAIPIEGARSYFSYMPERRLLRFDELSVVSKWGRGRLEGQAMLNLHDNGQLRDLVGQFRLSGLALNPDGHYPEPIEIAGAELDFRLHPLPFVMEIGRLQLNDGEQFLRASGRVSAGQDGWRIALDGALDGLAAPRLVELWPARVKPKTRNWIVENVREGRIRDASGALRFTQGAEPHVYLGFEFEEAQFTFADEMPPVTGARGHASIVDDRFVLVLDEGELDAPQGGRVVASGTSFIVPDTKAKPDPLGVVRLAARGSLTAAFSLLDQPPLTIMQNANLPVTVAEGSVAVEGTASLPLKKKTPVEEVSFDIAGQVQNARSTRLVKDREVAADALDLAVSEDEVRVSGRGTFDGVPLDIEWRQALGRPGDALPGRLEGGFEITPEALAAMRIDLPPGMVAGSAPGRLTLDMLKGTPPRLALGSDLQGLSLGLPQVGWAKPAAREGRLDVEMTLGDTPAVERLAIEAPGLSAAGSVSLTSEQKLDRIRFDEVRIGDWLRAPVDLVSRGEGRPPAVVLRGGTVDLRRADLPAPAATSGETAPLSISLDKLQISDTIALTDLRGDFATAGGLDGSFSGKVNGLAAVSGETHPQNGRSAIHVTSEDAGQVLRAAGLFEDARAGPMTLFLEPVGTGGAFDGKLSVAGASITDAPAMAELVNAISIVGLVNELNGDGIYFSEVTADFRLTPSRITLREAAAVGASMGLSMDGVFEPDSGRLQMQGVVSPVYMLNAIGSVFTRKGEGLFGFNYAINGTAKDPKVSVNPLSALAPGGLRNLFRGGTPEVPLEDGETPTPAPPRRVPVPTSGDER